MPLAWVSTRLAWPIAILTAALTASGLILLGLTFDRPSADLWGVRGFPTIFAVETAFLGYLLMSRRPENIIGLLLALVGVNNGIQLFASQYIIAGTNGALPWVEWVAWVGAFVWVPTVAILVGLVPLLFPNGRLLSARWRPIAWLLGVAALGTTLAIAVEPNVGGSGSTIPYPFEPPFPSAVGTGLWYVSYPLLGFSIVCAVVSLWARWRRSSGVEREQLKWLAWAGGLVVVAVPFSAMPFKLAQVVFIVAVATVPAAVGIAVLRYRLYEIDAVISRTLVYGALTAILAGLFAGLQRLLQGVFVSVTGNESDAALVITTLILATAFAPLKRTLEGVVARRLTTRPKDADTPGSDAPPEATRSGPGDLEAVLRRVVREELRAALNAPVASVPEAAAELGPRPAAPAGAVAGAPTLLMSNVIPDSDD